MHKTREHIMTGVLLLVMSLSSYCAGRFSFCRVLSGSMLPAVRIGDVVVIDKLSKPKRNDIAAYKIGRSVVIHRYKGIKNGKAVFKGDANNMSDSLVRRSDIVGKAVYTTHILNDIEDTLHLN